MTLGEVQREVRSKIKVQKIEARERASFDYIQAQLITKGVSMVLGDKSEYPKLEEVYPGLFDEVIEESKAKAQEYKTNLSALRFKQFAQSHNKNFKNRGVANDK